MNKMEERKEEGKEKTEGKEVNEDYDSGRHNKKKMKEEEAPVAYTESPIKYRIGSHFIKIRALVTD